MDDRDGAGQTDIYAQRISATGQALWTANGVVICAALGVQANPAIISDGNRGAFIVWQDGRSTTNQEDIWAQRVNEFGVAQWTANGRPVCLTGGQQIWPMLVSDGWGGAIITWEDGRNAGAGDPMEIYAQRVNGAGTTQWTAPPGLGPARPICLADAFQAMPMITSDGDHGAIITWYDARNFVPPDSLTVDIYAQRVNGYGAVLWTADGFAVCAPPLVTQGQRNWPTITTDGANGAIITWFDNRSGNYDVYAERIVAGGGFAPGWLLTGVPVLSGSGNQVCPKIVSDGEGGAIITCQHSEYPYPDGRGTAILAQRITSTGALPTQWPPAGVGVCIFPGFQEFPQIVSDGAGGAIIGWNDYRSGPSDIYAQRLDGATGTAQWISQGVAVSRAAGDQNWPVQFFPMVADGSGGAILTWTDARGGAPSTPPPNIYAQRVTDEEALGLRATVGFWRFEEGSGATTADWSGNGHLGYLDGLVAFTTETACDSIQGRPNDYALACSPNPLPDPGYGGLSVGGWPTPGACAGLTLEAWVRPRETYGTAFGPGGYIISKPLDESRPASFGIGLGNGGEPGGIPVCRFANAGGEAFASGSLKLPWDRWSHFAVTWDAQTSAVKIYLNYVEAGSGWFSGPIEYIGNDLLLGANIVWGPAGPTVRVFDGDIDEVRFSQSALEPSEFLRGPRSCGLPPLVAVWTPGDGEELPAGSTCDVRWNAIDESGIDSVTLLYSVDAEATFDTVANGEPNDGVYTWLVPATYSDSCQVRVIAYDADGNAGQATTDGFFRIVSTPASASSEAVPHPFRVESITPSPFRLSTTMRFTVPEAMPVTAEVWAADGRRVRVLAKRRLFAPGENRLVWDGHNDSDLPTAAGAYFVRLESPVGTKVARVVLLK
jgi:hypothetical protein